MFSALACVAFAFSGFASNEVVEKVDFQIEGDNPCEFWISVTGPDGETELYMFFSNLKGIDCFNSIGVEYGVIKRQFPGYKIQVGIVRI